MNKLKLKKLRKHYTSYPYVSCFVVLMLDPDQLEQHSDHLKWNYNILSLYKNSLWDFLITFLGFFILLTWGRCRRAEGIECRCSWSWLRSKIVVEIVIVELTAIIYVCSWEINRETVKNNRVWITLNLDIELPCVCT